MVKRGRHVIKQQQAIVVNNLGAKGAGIMAGGWARDGAVQDQIDAAV